MFYEVAKAIVRPVIALWWNPKVTGLENIPSTGPAMIAANHLANIDSLLVPASAPRKVRYIIKADFWHKKGLKAKIQQWFFEAIGSVPVERGSIRASQGSLEAALNVLKSGGVFGIYPEGTRSKTGKLGKAHTGIAWLYENSGAPIIPVGIIGTEKLLKKGSKFPRPRPAKVEIRFGEPVDLGNVDPSLSENQRRRIITELVMDEIAKLSGQERAETSRPAA